MPKQKLYCYVDETGQDAGSSYFIVVAVILTDNPEVLRKQLIELENESKIGRVKWHKLKNIQRIDFISLTLQIKNVKFRIYYGQYNKKLAFFLPFVDTINKAIKDLEPKDYQAVICVDGIDRKKASELTIALRQEGVVLKHVRTARDESEPLIRLADRWAGCIRLSLAGHEECLYLLAKARSKGLVKRTK